MAPHLEKEPSTPVSFTWLPNALTLARCGLAFVVGWSILDAGQGAVWLETPADGNITGETPDWRSDKAAFSRYHLIIHAPPAFHFMPFGLFLLAALSDFIDGYAARRLNAISAFGAFLDPVADKLLVACALLSLCHILDWPFVLGCASGAIIIRDLVITIIRLKPGICLPVSVLAKWKTTAEMVGIGGLLLAFALPETGRNLFTTGHAFFVTRAADLSVFSIILIIIAAGLSLYTGVAYMRCLFTKDRSQ